VLHQNNAFKKEGVDYHTSADLTGQANHLGVTYRLISSSRNSPLTTAVIKLLTLAEAATENSMKGSILNLHLTIPLIFAAIRLQTALWEEQVDQFWWRIQG
jgi:hypothetical protein